MDYPLSMSNASVGGFAVANSEEEHIMLSMQGYEPAYTGEPVPADNDVAALRAQLDAAGVKYGKRDDAEKLRSLLPKA